MFFLSFHPNKHIINMTFPALEMFRSWSDAKGKAVKEESIKGSYECCEFCSLWGQVNLPKSRFASSLLKIFLAPANIPRFCSTDGSMYFPLHTASFNLVHLFLVRPPYLSTSQSALPLCLWHRFLQYAANFSPSGKGMYCIWLFDDPQTTAQFFLYVFFKVVTSILSHLFTRSRQVIAGLPNNTICRFLITYKSVLLRLYPFAALTCSCLLPPVVDHLAQWEAGHWFDRRLF